jgi:GDPmannose 4,6-dehydratase
MNRALITGITGQDGAYLAHYLLKKGYEVYGTYRRLSTPNFWRLNYLEIFPKVKLIPVDLTDPSSLGEAITISRPHEIYHLAAQSFVEASFQTPVSTAHMTGVSVVTLLEAVRTLSPESRFYFAGTSELYGDSLGGSPAKLNEDSPFKPVSPYAAAKLFGLWSTEIYNRAYDLFACTGILFNHESPIRGLEFVTRKIANEVAKISVGLSDQIRLGNVEAKRDWGYAPEYVDAMWRMLQADTPRMYVVATGETHSVREFLDVACAEAGIRADKYLKNDKSLHRPLDVPALVGDHSRITRELHWKPKTRFDQLVKNMVREELSRWQRYLKGEVFPWDVPSYPDGHGIIRRVRGRAQ